MKLFNKVLISLSSRRGIFLRSVTFPVRSSVSVVVPNEIVN